MKLSTFHKDGTYAVRGTLGLVFLCLSALSFQARGTAPCDPLLLKNSRVAKASLAYASRDKGSRCEGFYRSDVGAPSLEAVSLLYGRLYYRLGEHRALKITAPDFKREAVNVRAQGIPLRLYYRMDAELPAGGELRWPLDLLEKEKLRAGRIGVLGRRTGEDVYVPLRAMPEGIEKPRTADALHLLLRASVDLKRMRWRYAPTHRGDCAEPSQWVELEPPYGGVFRAGLGIDLELPKPDSEQLCVESAAQGSRGDWLKQLLRIQLR